MHLYVLACSHLVYILKVNDIHLVCVFCVLDDFLRNIDIVSCQLPGNLCFL